MSPEQFNEAKRLIAGEVSVRAAAMQVGISESTLRVALKREAIPAPQSDPESTPQPQSDTESLLPPGVAERIGLASDRARRDADEARRREQDQWLANLRAKRGVQ